MMKTTIKIPPAMTFSARKFSVGIALLLAVVPLRAADTATTRTMEKTHQTIVSQRYERRSMVKVGDVVPNFRLIDDSGHSHMLSEYRGKYLMLVWTDPQGVVTQRLEKQGFLDDLAKIDPAQVVLARIEPVINMAQLQAKTEPHNGGGIVFRDMGNRMAAAFDIKQVPTALLLDKNAKVVYRGGLDNDPNGTLDPTIRIPYAANALKELLRGETLTTTNTLAYGDPVAASHSPSYTIGSNPERKTTASLTPAAESVTPHPLSN